MAFPDLILEEDAAYHSAGQGVPDNGDNEFAHGINTRFIRDHEDQLSFVVESKGASVTGAAFVGLSSDLTKVTLNFSQSGVDSAKVSAIFNHSIEW